jgi:hypothetical protein
MTPMDEKMESQYGILGPGMRHLLHVLEQDQDHAHPSHSMLPSYPLKLNACYAFALFFFFHRSMSNLGALTFLLAW